MPRSPLQILLWIVVLIVVVYVIIALLGSLGSADAATLGGAFALPSTFRRWRL